MAAIDTAALLTQLQGAATAVIGKDVTLVQGFSTEQLKAIAQQAALVAAGIVDGSITGDTQTYFLQSLQELVRSFVNTLAGLVTVVVEETWNAIVGVIWTEINKVAGLSLTVA